MLVCQRVFPHFFFFFPLSEKQIFNVENCRTHPESTWVVLNTPKFVDTEPLTATCLIRAADSKYHGEKL
jgi:hypothetical protein